MKNKTILRPAGGTDESVLGILLLIFGIIYVFFGVFICMYIHYSLHDAFITIACAIYFIMSTFFIFIVLKMLKFAQLRVTQHYEIITPDDASNSSTSNNDSASA